jgi:hypothetical protein
MRTFPVIASIVTGAALVAQPKDVDGWDKVKWGMTVAQAQAAYGSEARTWKQDYPNSLRPKARDYDERLFVRGLKIGGMKMVAAIETPIGSERVVEVKLTLDQGSRDSAYEALGTFLTQQYGQPSEVVKNRGFGATAIRSTFWKFPSTVIVLNWIETTGYGGSVEVNYTATGKQ